MVGMLQILTYLLAFYLVVKGVEVLQIALASPRQDRSGVITLGVLVLGACIIAAVIFVAIQDHQASSVGSHNLPADHVSSDSSLTTAQRMRVQEDVQAIKTQLQLYESMSGVYPTTEQGLQALVTRPQSNPQPARWYQLFRELPKDPWGNGYIYRNPGLKNPGSYDLFSGGPDGQADTGDDDWGGG